MHILLGLLSAIGIVVMVLWRINQAADVARGVGEAAADAQGFFRRMAWRQRANRDLIREIEDPREAAAVLLVGIAQYDGMMTEAEITTIKKSMMSAFNASPIQSDELIAHARWLTKDMGDLGSLFQKVTPVIVRSCNNEEKREFLGMLYKVASHSRDRTNVPTQVIAQLKTKIFVK